MKEVRLLSLVVPAYRQEKTIAKDIVRLDKTLSSLSLNYEIIVVVDGWLDKTYERAKLVANKKIKVLGYEENRGKGYAVRFGIGRAKGNVVGFIDSGMDVDPTGISMLLNHMIWYNADIIVGSKLHPVSQVQYPMVRKVLSWGYRNFTRVIFGFKIRDTQVGLKLFKRNVARAVFPRLLVKQFAFDVETLAVAYALGYRRIFEAPIKLRFTGESNITSKNLWGMTSGNFWKIIFLMLWDTVAVFYRLKILRYYYRENKKRSL